MLRYTHMKKNAPKYITGLIVVVLLTMLIFPFATKATVNLYVNDSQSVLSADLNESYAIGGNGIIDKISSSQAYVITGSGLTTVGVDSTLPKLEVNGTIGIGADIMKVGLAYGSSTVETASVENYIGSGYKFGYYDANRSFHEVGNTTETSLTLIKDTNIQISGVGTIGCYHIMLNNYYSSFSEASATAALYTGGFPAYYNGRYYVLIGNYTSSTDAENALAGMQLNGIVYTASNRCVVVTKTGTTTILFEFDCGTINSLAIRPISTTQAAQTKYKTTKYHGDFQFTRLTGDDITVVNYVDIEDYIKGVISIEMNESWPLEALKAQAVCARTYALKCLNKYSSNGFDVTCDTYSQAYTGTNLIGPNVSSAVESTAGQYAVYDGNLIEALYFSSDGGGTEDSENVFYNALPYLRGIVDPYEEKAADDNALSNWTKYISKATISAKINNLGDNFGTFANMEITYSDTENAISVEVVDKNGRTVSYTGSACYAFFCYSTGLGFPSIHFTIDDDSLGTDVLVFNGGGWGHNVGMSQFGAYSMALYYGYTYDQILAFYYTGIGLARGIVS